MSLVAYEASSGEESDAEEQKVNNEIDPKHCLKSKALKLPPPKAVNSQDTGRDEERTSNESNTNSDEEGQPQEDLNESESESKGSGVSFVKLPAPKAKTQSEEIIEEEDDEYLHKKETPLQTEKSAVPSKGTTVKITIPSLSEFKDLDKNDNKKPKATFGPIPKSGLLNMLPKPKQEQMFAKSEGTQQRNNSSIKKSLIPDAVKNRQANKSSKVLESPMKSQVKKSLVANVSDSEGSDDDDEDFFSLNSKQDLPEVSLNEINSMVAKKAAQLAETTAKYEKMLNQDDEENKIAAENEDDMISEEVEFDEKAIQMLVGSQAKRRKVEMNVVELSSEQVLPNKDEWLRTALAQATTYQPKGVLVDEEPAPGTRKKHQITYLAHQAKANEQELQAMWAANRHTRRQTQSKYGF